MKTTWANTFISFAKLKDSYWSQIKSIHRFFFFIELDDNRSDWKGKKDQSNNFQGQLVTIKEVMNGKLFLSTRQNSGKKQLINKL